MVKPDRPNQVTQLLVDGKPGDATALDQITHQTRPAFCTGVAETRIATRDLRIAVALKGFVDG